MRSQDFCIQEGRRQCGKDTVYPTRRKSGRRECIIDYPPSPWTPLPAVGALRAAATPPTALQR
jgi:hypothetical protein